MNRNGLEVSRPVHTLYFELHHLQHIAAPLISEMPGQPLTSYTLLVMEEGEGDLLWNDKEYALKAGSCWLLDPGSMIDVNLFHGQSTSFWLLSFSILGNTARPTTTYLQTGECRISSIKALLRIVMKISIHQNDKSAARQMDNHARFQKLMRIIIESTEVQPAAETTRQAVLVIIEQLKEHFTEDISVEELASQAQISKRRFTHWFKQITGKHVLEYITALRMESAKQLLLKGERLQEISVKVGYRDEFYFNRRFKQTEGLTPGQFVRNYENKPAHICALTCLGHLLALGIRPIAAAKNLTNRPYLRNLSLDIHRVNNIPYQLEEIAELHPEYILVSNEQECEELSTVASTMIFSQNDHKPMTLLAMLGEAFNKQRIAQQLILQYEHKAERYRTELRGFISKEETVSVIEIRTDSIYVFGNFWCRGAYNLYDGLGITAPPIIEQEMLNREAYRLITEEQLSLYAGDRLFVSILDPVRFRALEKTFIWKQLKAVQNNRIYFIDPEHFAVSDPISMHSQMDVQMKLLLAR
ncbi:helix-turn-helix domain-containing protein [Paenibacillus luteus]|uniref:helix-turn-helix domain-containing protein n=1 Tax=Paenibacillus luteus TaxID=2545753 RepID=UPI00114395E8|nr:helix-turn-helix domain-containing protein [Paenibacillus luteus]